MIHKKLLSLLIIAIATASMALEITPDTAIVLGEDATPAETTAASELQKYMEKISGHKLKIVKALPETGSRIIVGSTSIARQALPSVDFDKFRTDEIIMASPDTNTLILAGERPRGTLYAVYELLENHFKVRFYSVGNEVVPAQSGKISLAPNRRYAPQFVYRELHGEPCMENTMIAKWKLNGSMFRKKIPAEQGGYYQMDMTHSLAARYVNPKNWFESKPEWFAFRKKENARVPKQLCLSNPEVLAQLVKDVLAEQATMPERTYVGIGMSDNAAFCECDNCIEMNKRHASNGTGIWMACNAVAKALQKDYPHAQVVGMAYWVGERPPENLKFEPNVHVALAVLDRNHGIPVSATPRHDDLVKKFNKLTNNKVWIWDYYANFTNFILPLPNLNVIQPGIQTYRKFGIHGIFVQLPFGTLGEFVEFRVWLLAKLMWNPALDANVLKHDFFNGHYGKGAPFLISYVQLLENARDHQKGVWISCYTESTDKWLKVEDVVKANQLFEKALAATVDSPEANRRIKGLQASIILVNILRYQELAPAMQKAGVAFPARDEQINQLEALGKEFKCGAYKEWDDFRNLIKRLRETDKSQAQKAAPARQPVTITASQFTGSGYKVIDDTAIMQSKQIESAFSWMVPANGEIAYIVPPEQAGQRQVSITLRSTPSDGVASDAAYLGIYAPNEICRLAVSTAAGDSSWQQIILGKYDLPPNARIWVMPGLTAYTPTIEVKSIHLD